MNYVAVAVAGFFGAVLRKLLSDIIVFSKLSVFPAGTLVINVTGCFALSFFMTLTARRFMISPNLRLAVGTGFLGAYTTFSTFSYETISLLGNNHIFTGLLYVTFTTVGCLISAWAGAAAGKLFEDCKQKGEGNS